METDILRFDVIAEEVFFPIYAVLAQQIVERTGITSGACLDVGSGGGHLGLSLAKITELDVVLLDKLPLAVEIAETRIAAWGMGNQVATLLGDVHQIPAVDNTFDLIISRGSYPFWDDRQKGLGEIYRVLKPGGMTYVGGGFGTSELSRRIFAEMERRDSEWVNFRKRMAEENRKEKAIRFLQGARIPAFDVIDDHRGLWIVISKPAY
jgi:ubiquinone/menaquinone biosynthesis C-methylase UbiE